MRISSQNLVIGLCVVMLATCCSKTWAEKKGGKKDRAARRAARAEVESATSESEQTSGNKLLTRQDVEAALRLPCPEMKIDSDVPLSELLELIREHLAKNGTAVGVVPDTSELQLEGVESLDDIRIPPLNIAAGTHTCAALLRIIFDQTTDPRLDYDIRSGHLLISSRGKVESESSLYTRVYNVSDLLLMSDSVESNEAIIQPSAPVKQANAVEIISIPIEDGITTLRLEVLIRFDSTRIPADSDPGTGSGGSRLPPVAPRGMTDIRQMIQRHSSPSAKWFDMHGEGGQLSVLGQCLVIRQTPGGHAQIDTLLEIIREAMAAGGHRGGVSVNTAPAKKDNFAAGDNLPVQPYGRGTGFFSVSP